VSLDTPHTGVLHYEEGVPKIPAAAVSMENAMMLRRMWERGERITVHLEMTCEQLPDAPSANVVGEVVGREKPEEIVLVSGHLDSWDAGQGAQDDGVGCVLAMEAGHLVQRLGLKPRRTLRVVLFANEENGSRGGLGYLEAHRQELSRHVAAMESDAGNGLAKGLSLELHDPKHGPALDKERALARFRALLKPFLEPLGAGLLEPGGSGVDVGPIVQAGVPGVGVSHDVTRYWDVHHSKADTFDKINREDLAKNSAIVAIAAFLLADMPERLTP
jgi:Zn-dependent M28 family amino/carboxypeptidase